ncbi:MAG: glutaredoxin domain-containing protein [Desulfobulbaceae bacterium]
MTSTRACVLLCCLTICLQVILPPASQAKLYTWTDRNGVVRRTYYPPPPDQVRQNTAPEAAPAVQRQEQRQVRSNQVELYVTSWCPYCKKAIRYFQDKGIAFTVYDIEKDPAAAKRKQSLDGRGGVPFAVINGTGVSGYAPDRYGQALR